MRALLLPLPFLLLACSGTDAKDIGSPSSSSSSSSGGSSGGTRPGPTTPPQSAFLGTSTGCSNVLLYRATADGTQFVSVEVDREKLGLTIGAKRSFDLANAPAGVEVSIDVWSAAPLEPKYCTDHRTADGLTRTTWQAEAGKITIELTGDASATEANPIYRATITIEDAHFVGPQAGVAAVVPKVTIQDVRVGWLPG